MVSMPDNLNHPRPARLSGEPDGPSAAARPGNRLNLLLSYAGWRPQSWAEQLPQLLEPMGIASFRVQSGREASEVIQRQRMHIAVVDLGLPIDDPSQAAPSTGSETGGTRLLQIIRRLDAPPPTIVIRRPIDKAHGNERTLHEALREGAFTVLDVPVQLEHLLELMRRILRRHYRDAWPTLGGPSPGSSS